MIWLWLVLFVVAVTSLIVFGVIMFRQGGLMYRIPLSARIVAQLALFGIAVLVGHAAARISQIWF